MCFSHDMVWLGKVFSPGHIQLMCCALKYRSEGEKVRGGQKENNVSVMKVNCVYA